MLKKQLAPSEASTQNQIRQEYRAHLEKAKSGRTTPEKWINEWQLLYSRAQAYQIPEIQGMLALTDFLDAIMIRFAPEWGRQMRAEAVKRMTLNEPELNLEDTANVFNALLAEQFALTSKGKGSSIFAAPSFNEKSEPKDPPEKGRKRNACPCTQNGSHRWEPISCRKLQTAVEGSAPSVPIKLSDQDKKKINERYKQSEWNSLREQVKQKGWQTKPQEQSQKNLFPSSVLAALIDISSFDFGEQKKSSSGIYSATYSRHPLYQSTILDNGAAVHLVNNRDLLVPGTFRKAESHEHIDAGTQSLPVDGYGTRIIKNLLTGLNGPKTVDLQLSNVRVVEGFHLNIVSEARLRDQGKIWYLGLDRTLRFGSMKQNQIVLHLISKGNLNFLEYIVSAYSLVQPLVKAVSRTNTPRSRIDSEHLWHQRSGHLGQRGLQALARNAQNVQIQGITRKECEQCAITHASQVISRRPKERSPRPFFRIS